jgi:hypothetical protein
MVADINAAWPAVAGESQATRAPHLWSKLLAVLTQGEYM